MSDLPAAAITAAADVLENDDWSKDSEQLARAVLEAAAPHLTSQRELVLIWRDERGEEIARCPRLQPGTQRIAIPLSAQHCDLEATHD